MNSFLIETPGRDLDPSLQSRFDHSLLPGPGWGLDIGLDIGLDLGPRAGSLQASMPAFTSPGLLDQVSPDSPLQLHGHGLLHVRWEYIAALGRLHDDLRAARDGAQKDEVIALGPSSCEKVNIRSRYPTAPGQGSGPGPAHPARATAG